MRFVLIAVLLTGFAFAQAQDGNLVGSVLDMSGATVANAAVEAENTATGVKTTVTTDANGFYRFNNLGFQHFSSISFDGQKT